MPNTRSKKRKLARHIQGLDLSPGSVYKDLFNGRYIIQASYNDTVWFWRDGFLGRLDNPGRVFLIYSTEDFYHLIRPSHVFGDIRDTRDAHSRCEC